MNQGPYKPPLPDPILSTTPRPQLLLADPAVSRRIYRNAAVGIYLALASILIVYAAPIRNEPILLFLLLWALNLPAVILGRRAWRESKRLHWLERPVIFCSHLLTGCLFALLAGATAITLLVLACIGPAFGPDDFKPRPLRSDAPLGTLRVEPAADEGLIQLTNVAGPALDIRNGAVRLPADDYHVCWLGIRKRDAQGTPFLRKISLQHAQLAIAAGATSTLAWNETLTGTLQLRTATRDEIAGAFEIRDGQRLLNLIKNEVRPELPRLRVSDAAGNVIFERHFKFDQNTWRSYYIEETIPLPVRAAMRGAARLQVIFETGPFAVNLPDIPWPGAAAGVVTVGFGNGAME